MRFVRCAADVGPPACVAFVRQLPALLLLERGLVAAVAAGIGDVREPRALAEKTEAWLSLEVHIVIYVILYVNFQHTLHRLSTQLLFSVL